MGDGRRAEAVEKDTSQQPASPVKGEDFRNYANIFKPCINDNTALPIFTIFQTDKTSPKPYDGPAGKVSFDTDGKVRIYNNCEQTFAYGPSPNSKDTFVWTTGVNSATLSEIKHEDGSVLRFNPVDGRWQNFDAKNRLQGEERYHNASLTISGVTVTCSLDGPVTPERLNNEYAKLRKVFVKGETEGLIPFDDQQWNANLSNLRANEGFETKAYKDKRGYWTIGNGLNLDAPNAKELLEGAGVDYNLIMKTKSDQNPVEITAEQSEKLLRLTALRALYDCRNAYPGYDGYSQNVKSVLLDLMFNMGPETLSKFKVFNGHIQNGRLKEAARALLQTDYAKQVGDRAKRNVEKLEAQ